MDVLHQHTLVLELVTLRLHVQLVVKVLVDLASLTVLAQKVPMDAKVAGRYQNTPDIKARILILMGRILSAEANVG